ncbi:tryptophan ABC transporter substrate-binding protein [Vagococcus salmoninarum]|uniref:Peptide ABC transporter substrate-binding protein n=1 Tax=Vagococcus salmoninarum TaxID=2739 RepID=A0A429ZFR5_9ENTE|nr:tryptophan ABC transporter substrate-binding protein [Vagococcus salmoninarum]RST92499.1 peptide ABC transporter substrate-binding protein [Vagococcus salmoninarum]
MKNKGLISVIIIIGTVLVGSFIFEKNKMAEKAEGQAKIMTVGVLQFVSHPALDEIYRGIQAGLAEEGYTDQDNLNIEFQNGQADQSKLNTMSQQLIDKKADVLVGIATPAAQALANNTKDIPIVLGAITDPKSANLVADNQRPGGNITGVSDQSPVDAQLALALKLLPDLKTIGVLYSSAEDNSAFQAEKLVSEAEKLGMTVKKYPVPSSNEISQMVQVMSSEVDAIYLPTDNVIANAMQIVVDIANKNDVPIIPSVDTMVEQGGLATVGINQYELGLQTGRMVADILSGKSVPATTPIYTFTTGDIIINQKQADKLGIKIPADILAEAIITK